MQKESELASEKQEFKNKGIALQSSVSTIREKEKSPTIHSETLQKVNPEITQVNHLNNLKEMIKFIYTNIGYRKDKNSIECDSKHKIDERNFKYKGGNPIRYISGIPILPQKGDQNFSEVFNKLINWFHKKYVPLKLGNRVLRHGNDSKKRVEDSDIYSFMYFSKEVFYIANKAINLELNDSSTYNLFKMLYDYLILYNCFYNYYLVIDDNKSNVFIDLLFKPFVNYTNECQIKFTNDSLLTLLKKYLKDKRQDTTFVFLWSLKYNQSSDTKNLQEFNTMFSNYDFILDKYNLTTITTQRNDLYKDINNEL